MQTEQQFLCGEKTSTFKNEQELFFTHIILFRKGLFTLINSGQEIAEKIIASPEKVPPLNTIKYDVSVLTDETTRNAYHTIYATIAALNLMEENESKLLWTIYILPEKKAYSVRKYYLKTSFYRMRSKAISTFVSLIYQNKISPCLIHQKDLNKLKREADSITINHE